MSTILVKPRLPFYLWLESYASPMSPQEAVELLQEKANEIGIDIMTDINGVRTHILVGKDPKEAARGWAQSPSIT
jgi:hypothetical protein